MKDWSKIQSMCWHGHHGDKLSPAMEGSAYIGSPAASGPENLQIWYLLGAVLQWASCNRKATGASPFRDWLCCYRQDPTSWILKSCRRNWASPSGAWNFRLHYKYRIPSIYICCPEFCWEHRLLLLRSSHNSPNSTEKRNAIGVSITTLKFSMICSGSHYLPSWTLQEPEIKHSQCAGNTKVFGQHQEAICGC